MGVSTDAILFYGVLLPDDMEGSLPWSDDIESWWGKENGFEHSFEIYDESGDYLDGVRPEQERISAYYREWFDWQKANPMPVELIYHCSDEYPMYALALPGSTIRAGRGYPEKIIDLAVNQDDLDSFVAFCRKYGFSVDDLAWFMVSWWG